MENLTFRYYGSGAHKIDKNFHSLFADSPSLSAHFSCSRSPLCSPFSDSAGPCLSLRLNYQKFSLFIFGNILIEKNMTKCMFDITLGAPLTAARLSAQRNDTKEFRTRWKTNKSSNIYGLVYAYFNLRRLLSQIDCAHKHTRATGKDKPRHARFHSKQINEQIPKEYSSGYLSPKIGFSTGDNGTRWRW